MSRLPLNHRIFTYENREIEFSGDTTISLSDTVFGFLDEGFEGSPDSIGDNVYSENVEGVNEEDDDDEEKKENNGNVQDNSFWETQHQLLEATLRRTTTLESRIRQATKETLRETQQEGNICTCQRPVSNGCRNCLMKVVLSRLQNEGFNCAICKSKWRSSPEFPSGEHTFLEILDSSNPKKGEVRIIIELNLQGEFEMARASEEYNRLVKRLPEVFIGKIERLLSIIKILCSAAKRCMKEKKMHMGPWRKHGYMQAKWLRTSSQRMPAPTPTLSTGYSSRPSRPRTSMLTVDLIENLPNLHYAAVEVL